MEIIFNIVAIVISIIALGVAFWQGNISKQQLDQAKQTKNDTEKLLDQIKDKVNKIETISDETRKDMKEQIAKLIDKQDENFKTLLQSPQKTEQNQMAMQLMTQAMANPEMFKTIMKLAGGKK